MMAFGRDQLLKKDEIDSVVNYVRSLSNPAVAKEVPAARIKAAKRSSPPIASPVMATTRRATLNSGAGPDRSNSWIYGGDAEQVYTTGRAAGKAVCELG